MSGYINLRADECFRDSHSKRVEIIERAFKSLKKLILERVELGAFDLPIDPRYNHLENNIGIGNLPPIIQEEIMGLIKVELEKNGFIIVIDEPTSKWTKISWFV